MAAPDMTFAPNQQVKLKIRRIRIHTDPHHDIFEVTLSTDTGEWKETAGSKAELEILLAGVRAGAGILGGYLGTQDVIPGAPSVMLDMPRLQKPYSGAG